MRIRRSEPITAALAGVALAGALVAGTPPAEQPVVDANGVDALVAELEQGRHSGIEAFRLRAGGEQYAAWASASLAKRAPDLRSATKSITALLVGIAIDRGQLPGVGAKVIDLLPEYRKQLGDDPRKAAMRLEDLLTMRSGLACDDWDPKSPGHEDTMYRKRDWLEFWASRPMASDPGTRYSYCTGNVIALGRILRNATGTGVDEFAREALFEPLGIKEASWETWNRRRDVDSGGHLRLAPADLERIGRLVVARGGVGERRIVSESWIDQMTTEHTAIPGHPQRYGYLWWLDRTRSEGLPASRAWMAWGNGGNYLVVMPELDLVATFAGTRFNQPDALEPLAWMANRILRRTAPRGG